MQVERGFVFQCGYRYPLPCLRINNNILDEAALAEVIRRVRFNPIDPAWHATGIPGPKDK